jgi:hypothetical protein
MCREEWEKLHKYRCAVLTRQDWTKMTIVEGALCSAPFVGVLTSCMATVADFI